MEKPNLSLKQLDFKHKGWIILFGTFFFIPFLGGVHLFDWDEINFAEISREMILTGDYTRIYVNFQPFWEKPPLFFWLQALAMKIFGVGEFAARLPNALCGVVTLVVLYHIGKRLYNPRFGLLWAGAYGGSVLPFLYFKSGIIDPWFNLFIFIGLYLFILFYWKKDQVEAIVLVKSKWWYLFGAGFFIGMGILTKGQTAYLIAVLTLGVYWIYQRFRFYVNIPQFLFFTLAATLVTITWYGAETLKNGPWFIQEFNKYQYRLFSTPDAGHKGFPGYHFVLLLIGCFPASVFALRSFFRMPPEVNPHQQDFRRWMKMLFWVVLILFSIVKSKIVHYSSMCYFPLTFLAANVVDKILNGEIPYSRWMKITLGSIASIYIVAIVSLPLFAQNIESIKPLFSKDPFAMANLEAQVRWTGWEVVPGIFLLGVLGLHFWMGKARRTFSFLTLSLGGAFFVLLTLIFFVKRIEGYSQRAAVDFFKSLQGKDCYVVTYGYKSYAHLFYTQKPPVTNENSYSREWLLNGPIDKEVYVVSKIHRIQELEGVKNLKEIGRKNGFVFFRRAP